MRKAEAFFVLLWRRLKSDTPKFFEYIQAFMVPLTGFAVYLNAKVIEGTVPDQYRNLVFWFDAVIAFLHIMVPFLTTRNKELSDKTPKDIVNEKKVHDAV